jgi:hypothetical protein
VYIPIVQTSHTAKSLDDPTSTYWRKEKGQEINIHRTIDSDLWSGAGNGRRCAICHPATNNITIVPQFIATLPPNDPLFVAEINPDLQDLENPVLMRYLGLMCENLDGFDQPCVFRHEVISKHPAL